MRITVRISTDGRTGVVRRNFDERPTRAQVDACVDEVFGELNYELAKPARKKAAKKKAVKSKA